MDDVCARITFTIAVVITILTMSKIMDSFENENVTRDDNQEVMEYLNKQRFFWGAFTRGLDNPYFH